MEKRGRIGCVRGSRDAALATSSHSNARRSTGGAFVMLAVTLGLVSAFVVPARAGEPKAQPPRVAVLAFDNATGDKSLDSLGLGLQAMLTTDLSAASSLRLVERDKLGPLRAELELQRSRAIDKASASRLGKLLGASHLLAGAMTVAGETMRLDARLIATESGEVILVAKIEGQREAFFELEKDLVQRILVALEAVVTPKERARIGTVHTADFGAFRRFSDGISAFEAERFEEARQALQEAASLDEDFKLARLTLADYETIIAKLEARAALQATTALESAARKANEAGELQATLLEALWKSTRDGAAANQRERLASIYQLVHYYGGLDLVLSDSMEQRRTGDRFLLERTADALAKTYWQEAQAAWPLGPLIVHGDYARAPLMDKEYAQRRLDWLRRFFGEGNTTREQHHNRLIDNLSYPAHFSRMLHLDSLGEARFVERAFGLAEKLDPDALDKRFSSVPQNTRRTFGADLGQLLRQAGHIGESTRWFVEAARASHEPSRTEAMKREIERNRDIEALLAKYRHARQREWLLAREFDTTHANLDSVLEALSSEPPGPPGVRALAWPRRFRANRERPYLLIGDTPLFPMPETSFISGARIDPLRSDRFTYYRGVGDSSSETSWVAIFGARPAAKGNLACSLSFEPRADWWQEDLEPAARAVDSTNFAHAHPEVVLLFGLVDINVLPVRDPQDQRAERQQRGLSGYGLRILDDRVELVRVSEAEVRSGLSLVRFQLRYDVLATASRAQTMNVELVVRVDGRSIEARVGKTTLTTTLPSAANSAEGFFGFAFLGPGYAGLDNAKLTLR